MKAANPADYASIQALKDKHVGQAAWIVGKGPSLVMLSKEDIGDGPVIAINEAIIPVESLGLDNPLYSMQKDAEAYDVLTNVVTKPGESFVSIKRATLLVHLHESPNRMTEYRPRYVFDNVTDFGLEWWQFSSLVAVAIGKLMGCSRVVFVSHDACLFADARTCTPKYDGSYQVELEVPDNYLEHRQRLDDYLSRVAMPAEWVTPGPGRARRDEDERLVGHLNLEIERLRTEIHQRASEADRLIGIIETSQRDSDRLVRAEAETRRLTKELSDAWKVRADLEKANQHIEELTSELAATRHHVGAVLSSASWRWMAPLRAAKRLLMRDKR